MSRRPVGNVLGKGVEKVTGNGVGNLADEDADP
jgi:hypothetical protein